MLVCLCVSTRPFSFHSHETLFEVAPEQRRLVTLNLPVLDRIPAQVFVQLGDVNGGAALLVHRGGLPDPVVDVSCLGPALALAYLRNNRTRMRVCVCACVGGEMRPARLF